jgi:hypothetical protein
LGFAQDAKKRKARKEVPEYVLHLIYLAVPRDRIYVLVALLRVHQALFGV